MEREIIRSPSTWHTPDGRPFIYLQMAAWKTKQAKTANRKSAKTVRVRAENSAVDLHAELVADFRIHYQARASRVKNYGGRWRRLADGQLILPAAAVGPIAGAAAAYERENYTRDLEAEAAAVVDRFIARAVRKRYAGDMRGTVYALQVDDGGDDGFEWKGAGLYDGQTYGQAGVESSLDQATYFRWTGLSGLGAATIEAATLSVWNSSSVRDGTNPKTAVYFERADAPARPAVHGDVAAKSLTTAKLDVDGNLNPTDDAFWELDVAAVLQEIADNHDPSALCAVWDNDAGATGKYWRWLSYESDSAKAAKLDIDTGGGGGGGGGGAGLAGVGIGPHIGTG